jgi:hypothetical protein
MPPPLRDPVELGIVRTREGRSRAQFFTRDLGGVVSFEGPWRSDEESAKGDLSTIRAAAASKTERSAAIQAMEDEAERLKDEAKAGHGGVEAIRGEHRARVQYTDSNGAQSKIHGPCRNDKRLAQADLEAMRAAAANKPARAAQFEAMADEARRLQDKGEEGGVVEVDGEHRARVQYADAAGKPTYL